MQIRQPELMQDTSLEYERGRRAFRLDRSPFPPMHWSEERKESWLNGYLDESLKSKTTLDVGPAQTRKGHKPATASQLLISPFDVRAS